jgi:hypothetical protein
LKERGKSVVSFGQESSFREARFLGDVRFQEVDLSHCSFLDSNIDGVDFRYCKFAEKPERFPWFNLNPRQNVLRDELEADETVGAGLKPAPTVDELDGDEGGRGTLQRAPTDSSRVKDEGVIARDAVPKQSGGIATPATRNDSFWWRLLRSARNDPLREEKYEPVRRLYLELKRNFEDKKDWNTAGDFHYGEMECRRKMKGWLGRNLLSLEAIYFWASGYGERPLRAFVVGLGLMLVVFPLLYMLSEGDPYGVCVWDSVRVATFMRIGPPIEPDNPLGKSFLALEFFLLPTQFALFLLALRRKVKR